MADDLPTRCQAYLDAGPPAAMADYVPGSIAEIVIALAAQRQSIDEALRELAEIVPLEANAVAATADPTVGAYLNRAADLVREILARPTAEP